MAFSSGFGDRVDDVRSPNRHISGDENLFTAFSSISSNTGFVQQNNNEAMNDSRASLHRRFTTTTLPTMSGLSQLGQQRRPAPEYTGPDLAFKMTTAKLVEKKQAEYELMKKNRQKLQDEMHMLEMRAKREEDDMRRIQSDIAQFSNGYGRQSEPTTPPDYAENGFPTALSRPNRFSTSSITSPPGLSNRTSRAGSFVNSTPSERARAYQALTGPTPQSQPDTRRNSDGEDDEFEESILDINHRPAASLNRNSMPVTLGSKRNGIQTLSNALGPVNTSTFLFGPDEDSERQPTNRLSSYYQMNTTADNFPILVARDGDTKLRTSDPSTSQDLSQESSDFHSDGWPKSYARNSYHSGMKLGQAAEQSQPTGLPHPSSSGQSTPQKSGSNSRHSMGPKIGMSSESQRASLVTTPPNGVVGSTAPTPPKLQSSYSTNDIPTVKTTGTPGSSAFATYATTAEQRLHNHNVSLGRIPPNANIASRQSRDLASSDGKFGDQAESFQATPMSLQANQPNLALETPSSTSASEIAPPTTMSHSGLSSPISQTQYPGYGLQSNMQNITNNMQNNLQSNLQSSMQMLNASMGGLQLGSPVQMYQQQYHGYNPYQNVGNRFVDSQARVIQSRRTQSSDDGSRFTNIALENLQGEIYSLCKDQHGCRFLQKRLEEQKPENVQMIFEETKEHMIELMIDPFGNYLCQKLLEYANDEQRTALINNAAPHMVKIALNQHGTRALQKMIEFVSTPDQIQTVIFALKDQVVAMIQDLNGNHVIQKCLNRLSSQDAQFIFDAVAANCVVVGTHRHGCCVIQRCIDHASGEQKAQLVGAITNCSFPLVQDPFGNYVLQYIFDQGEESFSQPLCKTFLGSLGMLSKQKFSSNVIEKCIRIANHDMKISMIEEIISSNEFERLADDNYANYVVQTAWDYADADDQARMADKLRPLLARIKHKPYGRRLQTRVQDHDRKLGISTSGTMTPTDISSPETYPAGLASVVSPMHAQITPNAAYQSPIANYNGLNMGGFAPPAVHQTPIGMNPGYSHQMHRMNQTPMHNMGQFQQRHGQYPQQAPPQQQQAQQPPLHGFGRGPQNGMGYY